MVYRDEESFTECECCNSLVHQEDIMKCPKKYAVCETCLAESTCTDCASDCLNEIE